MGDKGKLRRGRLNRTKRGFTRSNGKTNDHGVDEEQEKRNCTRVKVIRILLSSFGLASIAFSVSQFHLTFEFDDPAAAAAKHSLRSFKSSAKSFRRGSKNFQAATPKDKALLPPPPPPIYRQQLPPIQPRPIQPPHEQRPVVVTEVKTINQLLPPPQWEIPTDAVFNKTTFEQRFSAWKDYRQQQYQEQYQKWLRYAVKNPLHNTNSTLRIIPYLHQTPMFKRRLSRDLMVLVLADNQCPLVAVANGEEVSATDRLLITLKHALQSQMVHVMAYLPHYHQETIECHNQLFQAIVTAFPNALQAGQLQIVTSPQLEHDRGDAYRYALNGLDFAYAAELAHQYADLVLILQAGSRLTPEWWLQYDPVPTDAPVNKTSNQTLAPPKFEAHAITNNRDYAWEVMLAWENRLRYDEKGLNHDLCYMNFAKHVGPEDRRYASLENPTGALWERGQLLRFSLALRSYAPYGKQPVSRILHRYCHDLLWEAGKPHAPLLLFEYTPKGNETQRTPQIEKLPIPKATTYPYVTVTAEEVPSWVAVPPSMVGPQPTGPANPLLQTLDRNAIIPTAAIKASPAKEQYWMTFVVPTAWRHTMSATPGIKGNTYVVYCLRQLCEIIRESFQGAYKSHILVLVSGRNEADIAHHRAGLQAELGAEIREGIVKLVDAPLDHYPTLHGLDAHYEDKEHRVRWRSKQNLDISAALFAAKGHGKYIMVIEDDSGFRAPKMFNGIRQQIANYHRQYNPSEAADFNPRVFANGLDQSKLKISYNEGHDPAETEVGHREIWSQVRFSFGYSGVLIHDEDAFVFATMHFLLYKEKPCDLQYEIADSVRNGVSKDHFLRYNKLHRFITHAGKMSTLEGKVFTDEQIAKG